MNWWATRLNGLERERCASGDRGAVENFAHPPPKYALPLQIGLPKPLIQLAGLIGEKLGGPNVPVTVIGSPLATLAARRHQVGPLLFCAVRDGRHRIAPDLLDKLENTYRTSQAHREAALARLGQVARQFATRNIPWMAIKGTTQAAQLYPDPAWRDSADIDLVVSPDAFGRALDALVELGFVASYPPVPPTGPLRWGVLRAIRDVTLIASDDHHCAIELHRRIFFASGKHTTFLHLPVTPGPIPAPSVGPDLAFYLIAHGALSYWVRLKWLADLVPLFTRLSPDDCQAILDLARRADCENSVAASLLLLRALFPFAALEPLESWLAAKETQAAVRRRLARYIELMGRDDDQKHSPLNDAMMTLEANTMLFESFSTRAHILLAAPLSSAMRRLSGRFYPADRALTLPAAPV